MWNLIKAAVLWCFKKENRVVGLKFTKIALDVASAVSKKTKSKKDDIALNYVSKTFDMAAQFLTEAEKEAVAKEINKKRNGALKDVRMQYESKKGELTTFYKGVSVKYNHKDGGVKFGLGANF